MSEAPLPEGVPEGARERLAENRGGLFTSDLTVNEYLLIEDAGFEPLGLVVGSSIYQAGYQRQRWTRGQELTALSQAMYHARELAMTRMEEEAHRLDADGIVGVRLRVSPQHIGRHISEFVAIGTAVRHRQGHSFRAPHGRPFTSDLSGQDFWTLRQTGARPVGLVMGSCVYSVGRLRTTFRRPAGWWGQARELPDYTQSLYQARELAMTRMQHEAAALSAHGIVGVQLDEHQHGWEGHLIEFFAIGTAIIRGAPTEPAPRPSLVLDLNDAHASGR
ncbi:MAG TPA: heavy metal-binding domain-containing protein [Solirubrobacteraceae bacterium]|nr:heavy metal-binding domain-containing protein [Solirubrobacteraceae bacterium]